MEHIDFHISYQCRNKCVFCSSSDSIKKFHNHPLKIGQIISILKSKHNKFKSVNFTGGEPTLYPGFPELVKETKNLGYKIYVGTNGGNFSDKNFCGKTAPFIDEVCFSFHGHKSALHNLHTKNKNSFKNLVKAVDNFRNYPVLLSANTVITKYNINYLKEILKFLVGLKTVKRVLISNLAPEGKGLSNYAKLAPRLSSLRKIAPDLADIADKNGLVIKFFGFPACTLEKNAVYSNDFVWDERLNIEQTQNSNKFILTESKGYLPNRGRVKTEKCRNCFYGDICGGIFEIYYKKFGDKELETIKNG